MLCFEGLWNETKMGMLWNMSGHLTELADTLRAETYFPIPLCVPLLHVGRSQPLRKVSPSLAGKTFHLRYRVPTCGILSKYIVVLRAKMHSMLNEGLLLNLVYDLVYMCLYSIHLVIYNPIQS
jgi:hypothetical protein